GKCRSVKELEHEQVRIEFGERGHRGVMEIAVGLARHAGEIGLRNSVSDKGTDHFNSDLGVRLPGEAFDAGAIEDRPAFGHVKAAVAGKAREHDINKIE